jgi:hypothetical protein
MKGPEPRRARKAGVNGILLDIDCDTFRFKYTPIVQVSTRLLQLENTGLTAWRSTGAIVRECASADRAGTGKLSCITWRSKVKISI